MKIKNISTYQVEHALKRRVKTSTSQFSKAREFVVKIQTDEGIDGYGAVSARGLYGNSVASDASLTKEFVEPLLVGKDPTRIGALNEEMDRFFHQGDLRGITVKAAVDIALHDVVGKILKTPIHTLLGGSYRDEIVSCAVMWIASPEENAQHAKTLIESGFKTIKMKVGLDPRTDLRNLEAVRKLMGDDVRINADVNGQWTPQASIRWIRQAKKFGLNYIEQPAPYWDLNGLAEVRKAVSPEVAVIADQSCQTHIRAKQVIEMRAADVINLKVGRMGFHKAKKAAILAEMEGLNVKVGTTIEAGIGVTAMIHFAAALKNIEDEHTECNIMLNYVTPLVDGLKSDSGGRVWKVPQGPGLGVRVIESDLTPI